MKLFNFFQKKKDEELKLIKTETGEWRVQRGLSILYIGTKEMCLTFMDEVDSF